MRRGAAFLLLVGVCVVSGCTSASNAARTAGSSTTLPTSGNTTPTSGEKPPISGERVTLYAERVRPLPQTLGTPPPVSEDGLLAFGDVWVCSPSVAGAPRVVRAADFQLVLPNGRHVPATVGSMSPKLHDGSLRPGSCDHGFVIWHVAPNQHPLILDVRTNAIWEPHCVDATPLAKPCMDSSPNRRRATVDDAPAPVPKGFAGEWFAHGIGITIDSAGRGTLTWRTYALCGEDPPPCDTFAGSWILDGGHAVIRLTLTGGKDASGDVASTTEPAVVPTGGLTARIDELKHELYLKPSSADELRFCTAESPSDDCGA